VLSLADRLLMLISSFDFSFYKNQVGGERCSAVGSEETECQLLLPSARWKDRVSNV